MQLDENPLLQHEDYLSGYREKLAAYKNDPRIVAFDRMCYELFETTELGRKFIEVLNERYLVPSLVNREATNYNMLVVWADGFKDCIRLLIQGVQSHKHRIQAEGSK